MSSIPVGKIASEIRERLLQDLQGKEYEYFLRFAKLESPCILPLMLTSDEFSQGFRGVLCVSSGKGKKVIVVVGIVFPDGMSMTGDRFSIEPDGKITLRRPVRYDD